jgi:hypothetical protein
MAQAKAEHAATIATGNRIHPATARASVSYQGIRKSQPRRPDGADADSATPKAMGVRHLGRSFSSPGDRYCAARGSVGVYVGTNVGHP